MVAVGIQWALAPPTTLAYVALMVFAARSKVWSAIPRALAPVGQMAFTNYLAQSLIMTAIFYGGRGLGLHGQVDRPGLAAITVAVWITREKNRIDVMGLGLVLGAGLAPAAPAAVRDARAADMLGDVAQRSPLHQHGRRVRRLLLFRSRFGGRLARLHAQYPADMVGAVFRQGDGLANLQGGRFIDTWNAHGSVSVSGSRRGGLNPLCP